MRGPGAQPRWGVRGAKPPPKTKDSDWIHNKSDEIFLVLNFKKCSNLHERCGTFWNEWKNQFWDFSDFIFRVNGNFCIQNMVILRWIFTIVSELFSTIWTKKFPGIFETEKQARDNKRQNWHIHVLFKKA